MTAAVPDATDVAENLLSIDELYREFYDHVSRSQNIDRRLASFRDFRSYHFKDLLYVRRNLHAGRVRSVLDVGCCGTPYLPLFSLDEVAYTAVDISDISLQRMRAIYPDPRIRWQVDDICRLDGVEDSSIDLILATQVFEHVPDPAQALRACARKLRPGGRLMIGTESAIFLQRGGEVGRAHRLLLALSLHFGAPYVLFGCEPMFYVHRENHAFTDSRGHRRSVRVPHGWFHPLYFHWVIRRDRLRLKPVFLRCSGGLLVDSVFSGMGERAYFRWLDFRARIPVLRHMGSQIFIVLERTDPPPDEGAAGPGADQP